METGTRSLRKAFKKGSWRDWPLAIGFSLFFSFELFAGTIGPPMQLPYYSGPQASKQANVPGQLARHRRLHLNTRSPSKPKLGQLPRYVSIPRHLRGVRVEPLRLLFAAHPGELP